MDYYLLIYFFIGILQDFLLTLNLRFIAKEKFLGAALTSFVATIITLTVLYHILTHLESEKSIIAIIIYALGIAIGTVLAMKMKISPKK